jgi:hypothetical protein
VARVVTSVAALVAVVAGVGRGINWINNHVWGGLLSWTGLAILVALAIAWGVVGVGTRTNRFHLYWFATVILGTAVVVIFRTTPGRPGEGYLLAAIALAPPALEIYRLDRALRTRCPDCREEIRADANVCKHCGFRLATKPDTKEADGA